MLTHISRTHRITAAHLARQLEITRRQATALISEMAKRGLVARGESDGRYDVCINSAR